MLSCVETERVLAVLEETLDKMKFLGSITPDILAHREELSQSAGDEVSRIIQEQRHLEKRYEELISERGALKGLSNKMKYKKNQKDIQDVSRKLRESTKKLCRSLKDNPDVGGNLLKIQKDRNNVEDLLRTVFRELAEKSTFDKLLATVDEDKKCEQDRENLVLLEKETTRAVQDLEKELEEEKYEHQEEVKRQNDLVETLKQKLSRMESTSAMQMEYRRAESMSKLASKQRTGNQVLKDHERKNSDLQFALDSGKTAHDVSSGYLSKKIEWVKKQTDEWNERFEKEKAAVEVQLAELKEKREQDHAKLIRFRKRADDERAEKAAIEAERLRQEDLERHNIAREKCEYHMANKLQDQWKVKQEAMKAAGGNKKKKKKKKKKK